MEFETLVCERHGTALVVRLNRPEKLNSLSQGMLRDLRGCAEAIQRDRSIRAVLLSGSGRGFCAGADLTEPGAAPAVQQSLGQWVAQRLRNQFHPAAVAWSSLSAPLVVAVHGIAAGAGVSLALLGDITIAARSASFAVIFTPKLGLTPDMGATQLLPSRVGVARARYLALTGRPVSGEEAERIGLVAECVDDAALEARAMELTAMLAAGPTQAQLAVRTLMADGATRSLAEQMEREAAIQHGLADTPDFLEGLSAFRDKRVPQFRGS